MSDTLHPQEARRLALLQSLDVIGAPVEAGLQALAACAARVTGAPAAMLTVIDAQRQWSIAVGGHLAPLPSPMERADGFCIHALASQGVFEVPDALADARFRSLPCVRDAPHLRFYAGQPLRIDGVAVGSLCILDVAPRVLSPAGRETLQQLARAAVELLQSRRHLREVGEQRKRLLDFARAAGDWMWESDAEHRCSWLSDGFNALTGLQREALLGQPMPDAQPLDASGQPQSPGLRFRDVLNQRAAFTRVITEMHTPRGRLHVSHSAVPVLDGAGGFAGFRGTSRDVTATLAVAAAAQRSETMLRQLTAQVPGVLFILQQSTGSACGFRFVSDGAARELGVGVTDLMADSGVFFERLPHHDRLALRDAALASTQRKAMLEHSFQALGPDGRLRWYETRATPTPHGDGSWLWHGFVTDISERTAIADALRIHEERWQIAADAASIGIAHLTLADGHVRFDAIASRNHGLAHPNHGLTFDEWVASIDPADRPAATIGVGLALREGTPFEGRCRVLRPDGSTRWLEFVTRATRDASGRIDGLIGTCRDVHDQQIAAELQREKHDAERASHAKSALLSRVSHELRTPLNGILGFAQLMALDREQPLGAAQAQRLASVQRSGRQLLGLVNDVLELSRVENAEQSLNTAWVDLGAAVRASVALSQPLAQVRGIALVVPPNIDASVRGDARAIEQVLANLLADAIQYGPEHSAVVLELRTLPPQAGASGHVGIRISSSNGRHALDGVVAPAPQPDTSLALAIAHQLAQAMGGRVDAPAPVGVRRESTLWLTTADAMAEADGTLPAGGVDAPVGVRHVLYVEDEPLNQILVQEVFRARAGWRLHVAPDGASGLRMARELAPQLRLVLIDMNLPDTTGVALLKQLRSDSGTRGLRCIALSADALREQMDAARAAGFENYWTKPIDVPQVLAALDGLLDAPR